MTEAAVADWWARGIGIAALGISTLALTWNVFNAAWRDRARLRVGVSWGVMPNGLTENSDDWMWFIEAANVGRRPITVSGRGGVEFPTGQWLAFAGGSEHLPKRLEEGSRLIMWITERELIQAIGEQGSPPSHVVFKDDSGRTWRKRIPSKYTRRLGLLRTQKVTRR